MVRIYGPDLKGIHEKADEVEATLKDVPGIVDLHVQLQSEVPQIQVEVNLAAAERYRLKPGDVRRAAGTLMAGEEVGDLFIEHCTCESANIIYTGFVNGTEGLHGSFQCLYFHRIN